MARAATRKWIHRAERVVNMRRRNGTPSQSMLTWRRPVKFARAMAFVLAQPIVFKSKRPTAMTVLRSLFTRRQAQRLVSA